jgi:hypothetical protein
MEGMRGIALFLPVLPSAALATADLAADPAVFDRIDAGIICAPAPSGREPAPGTRIGFIDLVDGEITLGQATPRIPALPGLAFGVVARVAEHAGAADVTITVTHPPMGADGIMRETWQTDLMPGGPTANFFRFDYPEERVPGDWTLQAEQDGRVLYAARFQVVDPRLMPGFVDPCAVPPQLS